MHYALCVILCFSVSTERVCSSWWCRHALRLRELYLAKLLLVAHHVLLESHGETLGMLRSHDNAAYDLSLGVPGRLLARSTMNSA